MSLDEHLFFVMPGKPVPASASAGTMGSKAYGLMRLARLGLNVPPAFVLGTEICRSYLDGGKLPDGTRELLARVRAVLRRYQVQATLPERDHTRRAFRFAGWEFNLRTRRLVSPAGVSVELSNGEFSLLSALCRAPGRVLTRDQLLSMSRLHEAEVYDRSIDVQIRRLRVKIEVDAASPTLIVTERGAGYRLASEVETLY